MRICSTFLPLAALTTALALGGCCTTASHDHRDMAGMQAAAGDPHAAQHVNMWAGVTRASATIYPTKGNDVSGTLWFDQAPNGVHIHGDLTGLAPNSTHAMHIHEFGDQSSADGTAAGGHYNPESHPHAGTNTPMRHAGDLGNIKADASGKATVDLTVDNISIADLKNPVVGRGVVIHANADDFQTQPTGNAGGRIGVGVIGVAKK
jgi:Cu-Zn family superoxide dismutase